MTIDTVFAGETLDGDHRTAWQRATAPEGSSSTGSAASMLQQRINPEYFRCAMDFGDNNIVIFAEVFDSFDRLSLP
jgi:hypothetical protein